MPAPDFIVVSYDVPDNKRRTKIHKALKAYGQWMQYSLFECRLTGTQLAQLKSRLSNLIEPQTDSIRFYYLCEACNRRIERIGGELPRDESIFFV